MIDAAKVRTFDDLYLQIAKLKPKDRKHVMTCLKNRQRTLHKEIEMGRRTESRISIGN